MKHHCPDTRWLIAAAAGQPVTVMVLLMALLAGCGHPDPITGCAGSATLKVVCGFQNPEDMALLADGEGLIVSQFGAMDGSRSGNLVYTDLQSPPQLLFQGGADLPVTQGWGDPACPGAPSAAFSPHGMDLDRRPDGHLQLLVVNHGGREAVEFFEVATSGPPSLVWRGCVPMDEKRFLNDVLSRSDGGFWATHMYDRDQPWKLFVGAAGIATGEVITWSPGGKVEAVPGTEGQFPNGIEKSADESLLYINMYLMSGVVKYDISRQKVVGKAELPAPDNLHWDLDGVHLLVASQSASMLAMMGCQRIEQGSCGARFEIVRVDTRDMSQEPIFSQEGAPMGAVTVAVPVGDHLALGTFAGDRIGLYHRAGLLR